MMKIIGYFVDTDGDKTKATDVFVGIEFMGNGKFEYYCPVGQHGEGYVSYLAECNPISKEEYLKASEGLYTPSDYVGIRLSHDTWKNIFRNIKEAQEEQEQEEGIEELIREGIVQRIEVEVVWLDNTDEWCLCSDCEMFEDGFKSEKEAQERLDYLEKTLL